MFLKEERMSRFERPTEPEDYVRDALVVYVLMRAFDYSHGRISDNRLVEAFLLFLELLEIEGVSTHHLFYDNEDQKKLAVTNALSRMVREEVLYSKSIHVARHYFEGRFFTWAQEVIARDLPKDMSPTCLRVVEVTMPVLAFGDNPERILDKWKSKRKNLNAAT